MGPSRKQASASSPSSSQQASSTPHKSAPPKRRPQHKQHPARRAAPVSPDAGGSGALPGVQKLKAALRQTRRLLAKDTLAADVRVATERRLRALEADLAKAERARVERALAARYHKIKFFERQKVARKLAQARRRLTALDGEGEGEGKGKGKGKGEGEKATRKEREELEGRLAELRVDLNYILNYPKTRKYISLFPPEVRQGRHGQNAAEQARAAKEKSETDRQREEIRARIREQMDAGVLSWEPEVELEKSERRAAGAASLHVKAASSSLEAREKKAEGKKGDKLGAKAAKISGVADDEFFGADDDEEGEEGEGSDVSEASKGEGEDGSDRDIDMDGE